MKIFSALFLVLATLMVSFSAAAQWPPETGAKVAGNALELPTQLSAVNTSLEQLLNQGGSRNFFLCSNRWPGGHPA